MNKDYQHYQDSISFVGEQDGEPERELKGLIIKVFEGNNNIIKSYLARIHYGDPNEIIVALCIFSKKEDEKLVMKLMETYKSIFSKDTFLDIMFLRDDQIDEIEKVCSPFYDVN